MNRPLLTRRTWLASGAATVAVTAAVRPARAQSLDAINVGLGLIESHAEGYYAQELGIFTKHNLNVTLKQLRNGATIAAAVASGDLQAGCSTILQLVQARGRTLPFSLIAAGAIHDGRVSHTVGLAVGASSKVTAPKELNGKTIAVSTLNGLDQLIASVLIDKNGGDSSTLKFVELAPPAMIEALAQGRIDAASMEDPELSAAGKAIRSLGDGEDAIAQRFVTTAWFSSTDWLTKNPAIAQRFAQAIFEAGAWANANPDKAAVILQKYLHFTEARTTARFATRNLQSEIAPLAQAAVTYKFAPAAGLDLIRGVG